MPTDLESTSGAETPDGVDPDVLRYAEEKGEKNMQFHLDNIEALIKEAHVTLSFQIIFAGACFGYVIRLLENGYRWPLLAAMSLLTLYLAGLGAYTTRKCLHIGPVMPPANEPGHMLYPGYDVDAIRETEVFHLQESIDYNRKRCEVTGDALNKSRLATVAAPLFFLVVLVLFYGINYVFA